MVKDTIQAVKDAEEKAAGLVSEASENGKVLVAQAKKEAETLREETSKKLKEELGSLEQKLQAEDEAYLAESIRTVGEDIASLKKNAEDKAAEVVKQIVGELI